jgi:archaellum component FlaC
MLSQEELEQIKNYVFHHLPSALEQDTQFALMIEGMLSEKFPRRDEFTRLLDELCALRVRHEEGVQEMREGFQRLDGMDARFDKIDERLDGMDARFDKIDERLDGMDARFDKVDERFEQIDRRFEQVDQRFEQVDRRFEQVDRRFEQVDRRFEQVDRRFEEVKTEISNVKSELRQDMRQLRDWVELTVGRLQTRSGKSIEEVVAGALRLGLSRSDIEPSSVRMRQKIKDTDGLVLRPGSEREVDLIAQNSELLVFEVKSNPKLEDVDNFADKVRLIELQNPDKEVKGILIVLGAEQDLRRHCSSQNIMLIP